MKASFPFGDIVKSTRTSGTWEETRQRGAGKKRRALLFLPSPVPHPRGSLAHLFSARFARPNGELALRLFTPSSKVQCLFPTLVNGGRLKPSATAPGKFDGWHYIRTLWGRLGTSLGFYHRQASCLTQNFRKGWCTCWVVFCLFVCLFVCFRRSRCPSSPSFVGSL